MRKYSEAAERGYAILQEWAKEAAAYKVKAFRPKSYPGDTFIRMDVTGPSGRTLPVFGLWPKRDRSGRYYESDYGPVFKTISDAKERALTKAIGMGLK